MGMDNSVWLSMMVVLIISTFILGFKVITNVNCAMDDISTAGIRQQTNSIYYIGETVTFSISNIPDKEQLQWNFDDGLVPVKSGKIVQHGFLKEGNYTVTCLRNNGCEQSVLVSVIPSPVKGKDTATKYAGAGVGVPIIGLDTVPAGVLAHYSTLIKANYSYQWSISNSPDIQTTAAADFNLYKEGLQIITLKIDGNKSYTKSILVLAKKNTGSNAINSSNASSTIPLAIPPAVNSIFPVSGGPGISVTINGSFFNGTKSVSFGGIEAKSFQIVSPTQITAIVNDGSQTGGVIVTTENGPSPQGPLFTYITPKVVAPTSITPAQPDNNASRKNISDANLKTLLTKVAKGDPNVTTQKIAEFFCGGEATVVKVNADKKVITLSELCKRLQETKDATVESAKIVRDPNNPDCEINILVSYSHPNKILGIKVGKTHD